MASRYTERPTRPRSCLPSEPAVAITGRCVHRNAGMEKTLIDDRLRRDMIRKHIDIDLTMEILEGLNSGHLSPASSIQTTGVPAVDGKSLLSLVGDFVYRVDASEAKTRFAAYGHAWPADTPVKNGMAALDRATLADFGERLYEVSAWGVLNGGSASSYADRKKNGSLGAGVFEAIREGFETLAPLCEGLPKGLSPAYLNPDGSVGESFLVLKMRSALLKAERYRKRFGAPDRPALPFFQMTSRGTDEQLRAAYSSYRNHPWLSGLIDQTGTDPTRPWSAVQPLIAAFTHSTKGTPRRVFDSAYGKPHSALALPGGHGQSFRFLADVYGGLLEAGYRFAYIGNVDNVGYSVDPVEIAILCLSGAEAAFDFSYRTPVDVKGGILVLDEGGRMTIGDLGQAIAIDEAEAMEARGERILFNCATGLFNLEALVPKLDAIASRLPLRLSDQDKDAGRYSQAEQSTWEVLGLLDRPIGFAVNKADRFLAAKLLAETILGSGAADLKALPPEVAATAQSLSHGLAKTLAGTCDLALRKGRWTAAG
ncbi:MAG: hypothetical protein E4H20_06160 [Spirochaetales bacterium]|nr:MAG: hypothetical protein E4H20_06160 [Spirochaetales bacterium]